MCMVEVFAFTASHAHAHLNSTEASFKPPPENCLCNRLPTGFQTSLEQTSTPGSSQAGSIQTGMETSLRATGHALILLDCAIISFCCHAC